MMSFHSIQSGAVLFLLMLCIFSLCVSLAWVQSFIVARSSSSETEDEDWQRRAAMNDKRTRSADLATRTRGSGRGEQRSNQNQGYRDNIDSMKRIGTIRERWEAENERRAIVPEGAIEIREVKGRGRKGTEGDGRLFKSWDRKCDLVGSHS